jgi:hypothetical protein
VYWFKNIQVWLANIFSLALGPSSLRSLDRVELRRTHHSLGGGGHPQRELTLMAHAPRALALARFAMAAGAQIFSTHLAYLTYLAHLA